MARGIDLLQEISDTMKDIGDKMDLAIDLQIQGMAKNIGGGAITGGSKGSSFGFGGGSLPNLTKLLGNPMKPFSQLAGVTESIGNALGLLGGKLGKFGVAVGSITGGLLRAVDTLSDFSSGLADSQIQMGFGISPAMTSVGIEQKFKEFKRAFELGQEREKSTRKLMEDQFKFKREITDPMTTGFLDAWTNIFSWFTAESLKLKKNIQGQSAVVAGVEAGLKGVAQTVIVGPVAAANKTFEYFGGEAVDEKERFWQGMESNRKVGLLPNSLGTTSLEDWIKSNNREDLYKKYGKPERFK